MVQSFSFWFQEFLSPDFSQQLAVRKILFSGKTPYQDVQVVETFPFGRCLILDGKLQSAEADEFIYHEALVHPPLICHPSPETVFIAGGGEGATLREVLSHRTVKQVIMVDLDREVVDICRCWLPSWHQGAFDDSRVELIFADARSYLARDQRTYDVIIMDITDPVEGGPSYLLFTREFYLIAREKLNPKGIICVQAGPSRLPSYQLYLNVYRTLKEVWPCVFPYQAEVPSFGGNWGFVLAGEGLTLPSPEDVDRRLSQRVGKELQFYDGVTHQAMFSLPKFIRLELETRGTVITDEEPQFVY